MRKLKPLSDRPSGLPPTPIGLLDSRMANLVKRSQAIGLNPSAMATASGLIRWKQDQL
jgi:hypothetical protein